MRILLVDGERKVADGVEEALRRDLPSGVRIVRARRFPTRVESFDAAVVIAKSIRELPSTPPDLPTVLVSPTACARDCADLARRGVQHSLPEACATCRRQSLLGTSVQWAIERARLVRDLEEARRCDQDAALHDPLTGLPNLRLYRERFRQLLTQCRRTGKRVAILFVDLDRFKEVNDGAGHAAGDRLLEVVADRIRDCTRETDTVARRGGDEFVVLLDDVRRASDAAQVARSILRRISRPAVVSGTIVRSSASIGIAVFPDDGTSEKSLEQQADLAMYRAKRLGGSVVLLAGSRSVSALPAGGSSA
jgi:diguanylate cyclase (GGDEF)-like protein